MDKVDFLIGVLVMPWYFAYGRNVNIERLIERIRRTPSLTCRAILPGYELRFNKTPGPKGNVGYANIVPAAKKWVEGLLYMLTEQDLTRLDEYEGVPKHYRRSEVMVWNIEQGRWVNAITYIAVKTDDSLKPPREYLMEIISAAEITGLSPEWISSLKELLKQAI